MSMIISGENLTTQRIDKSQFEREEELQRYIYDNPEIIPISEIKEEAKLLILSREFPTNSGAIDALGIDQDGEVYIIETKLYKNSDKRRVIAQVLDYGAALFFHGQSSESFFELVEKDVQRKFEMSWEEKAQSFFALDGEAVGQLQEDITSNLREGRFRFIILMDDLEDRLKDLIKYLNMNSNFTVYGVELDYYQFQEYQIVLPRIFGTELSNIGQKDQSRSRGKNWNESSFLAHAEQSYSEEDLVKVHRLYEFTKREADELHWGKGEKSGSFSAIFYSISSKPLYYVDSKDWIWWRFDNIEEQEIKQKLMSRCEELGLVIPKDYFGSKMQDVSLELVEGFLEKVSDFL